MFCSECGSKVAGAYCGECGTATAGPIAVYASADQVVVAQILVYVEQNWAEDFADFLEEIPIALIVARTINDDPKAGMTVTQLSVMEESFGDFISGAGYDREHRFESLAEFLKELG